MASHCGFGLHLHMANVVDHLFMCLKQMYECLFKFLALFNYFLLLNCKNSLYIWILDFYQKNDNFSLSVDCLFLMMSFDAQLLLILINPNLPICCCSGAVNLFFSQTLNFLFCIGV